MELTVSLTNNATGAPIKGAYVVVKVAGKTYKVKITATGEGVVSLADVNPGSYVATASYKGGTFYNAANTTVDVAFMGDANISAVYDEDAKELTVTLVNNVTGAPIKGANVVVKVAGKTYKVKITATGEGVVSLADVNPGSYVATASYKGGTFYNAANTTVDVAFMGDANISAVYDEDAKELTVTLVNNVTGAPIKGANVVVKVAGETYKVKIEADGQGVVSLADVVPGAYVATVSYKGGAKYYPADTTVDIVIMANTTIFAVYDDEAKELVATLINNATGEPIEGSNILINLNGENYTVETDSNGQAIVSTEDLDPGIYTAAISYEGSTLYNPTETTFDVIVKYDVVLTAVFNEETKELTITLINNVTGDPLKGANVIVRVAGEKFTVRINANGEGVVSLAGINPGSNVATVSYRGSTLYKEVETTVDVAFMGDANISAVYNDATKELTVTLVNNVSGKALKGAYAVVKVDGKTYKVSIDASGEGVVSLADLAPGSYDASVSYKGGSKYNPVETTVEVIVKQD